MPLGANQRDGVLEPIVLQASAAYLDDPRDDLKTQHGAANAARVLVFHASGSSGSGGRDPPTATHGASEQHGEQPGPTAKVDG